MRTLAVWVAALVVLGTVNSMIWTKERVLAQGTAMHLALAPVDPRSLIQGDYMELAYRLENETRDLDLLDHGRLVVALDPNRVAHFVRLDDGRPLAEGQYYLVYRLRGGMRLGAESFFFQEGQAELYESAKYGLLMVDSDGNSVLAGLVDENFKRLGPTGDK